MFTGVDRALFASALAQRMDRAGVPVPFGALGRFLAGLDALGPVAKPELYWLARIALVEDHRDIGLFDQVFAAIFDLTLDELKENGSRRAMAPAPPADTDDTYLSLRIDDAPKERAGTSLPWATMPSVADSDDDADDSGELAIPERLPSTLDAELDTPFDLLDAHQLSEVEAALAVAFADWPVRRSRRRRDWKSGDRVDMRATLRGAMRTGGEPFLLHRSRPRQRPRRIVVMVDVSGSMQSFARPYLHLTRALVVAGRAEVFAFATRPTRITTSLKHRSPTEAIDRASAEVGDRYGGTRLASSLRQVLAHRTWGSLMRGLIVVIASDGWDTDPPAEVAAQMAKLARRAHRVVWLNPRSARPDYEPLVAPMAAALPHCDHFLPGHNMGAMHDVIAAIIA